jgi:hypothetical protein
LKIIYINDIGTSPFSCRAYKAFKNDFLFEKVLTGYLAGIVAEYSQGKPTLVFCR